MNGEPPSNDGQSKGPPLKLAWSEEIRDWLDGDVHGRPESYAVCWSVVLAVVHATTSKTSTALLSARWVESKYHINKSKASRVLNYFAAHGWIKDTGRRVNRVPVYEITIPTGRRSGDTVLPGSTQARSGDTVLPGSDRSGDGSGDGSGDDGVPHSRTPGTPQEDINKEKREETRKLAEAECANCGRIEDHDPDCPYRLFE